MTTTMFVRPVTERAYMALMLDVPLSPAAMTDFGASTTEHYAALQATVRAGATRNDLDAALGSGHELTALVKRYTGRDVAFTTAWDLLVTEAAATAAVEEGRPVQGRADADEGDDPCVHCSNTDAVVGCEGCPHFKTTDEWVRLYFPGVHAR